MALTGYLVVKVLEAAGHNANDVKVWDETLKEAFVKIEIRGGPRTIKKTTSLQKVQDNAITWEEQLELETLEGAGELRIMLCRQKKDGEKVGSSIVAACGIYMRDILDAVPIDKYFELFKPGAGQEGGFIRVSMNFLNPDQVRSSSRSLLPSTKKAKKGGFPFKAIALAAVAGGLAAFALASKGKKEEQPAAKDAKGGKGLFSK